MITINYISGASDKFEEANYWDNENCIEGFIEIIKRTYDEDDEYDEDEDKTIALISLSQIRSIIEQ